MSTTKINQLILIKNLVIDKRLVDCNANIIPMKTGLSIKIEDPEDYKETNFWTYQQLIGKLMYLVYSTRPDIVFVVRQLSK